MAVQESEQNVSTNAEESLLLKMDFNDEFTSLALGFKSENRSPLHPDISVRYTSA
jgi:hypothetical protein